MRKLFKLFWVLLFVIGATVPLFHMNTADITEQENRTLAKFPAFKKNKKLNANYGKEFETWLGDRFGGRKQLIDARFKTLYIINGRLENEKAFVGDDGWMFLKSEIKAFKKQKKNIEKDALALKKIADIFKEKNTLIYLMFVPSREDIYQKYWEKYYSPGERLDYEAEMAKVVSNYPNIRMVPVKEDLNTLAKEELIFYKDDVHLTKLARNFIIRKLFQKMADDRLWGKTEVHLKEEKIMETHKQTATIGARLGLPGKTEMTLPTISLSFPDLKSKVVERKEFKISTKNGGEWEKLVPYKRSSNDKAPILKQGVFLGPCYAENAYDILNPLFKTSVKVRYNAQDAGDDAVSFMKKKVKELKDLDKESVLILVLLQGNFDKVEKMLNEE